MTTYLLDVNMLLALADPMHVHHEPAHSWFAARGRRAWATCPLTENGFIRVASHPGYPNRPGDVAAVMAILQQLRAAQGHEFWSDDVSICDLVAPDVVLTHTQITDVYLLGLARARGGKLATLDQRLPASAVVGGAAALELVNPRSYPQEG